ncbi:MAG: 4Fe-4S binding protein [candidate division WOR-3 bacterium]
MFKVAIRKEWCKGCLFCYQICPKKVFEKDASLPKVAHEEKCIGCLLCEYLCPDLAITVEKCQKE